MTNSLISIKYHKDSHGNALKTILFLGVIIATIIALIIYPSWQVLGLGVSMILLLRLLVNKPDGELRLIVEDGKTYLRILSKDAIKQQELKEVKSKTFFWNYMHEATLGFGDGDETARSSHANYIQLNLELELKNGKRILLYEQLNPWQETPTEFNYKVFELDKYDELLILVGKMKELKEEFI